MLDFFINRNLWPVFVTLYVIILCANTKAPSSPPSPKPCAKQNFLQSVSLPWLQAQSMVPWTMWARSSGTTSVVILDSRKTGILFEFYKNSTKVIKTRTQIKDSKKQSISVSSNKSIPTSLLKKRKLPVNL